MSPALSRDPHARYVPFVAVGLLGQLSALWPSAPAEMGPFWASCALLAFSVVLVMWLPRWPGGTWLVASGAYVASVSFLIISVGGSDSGLGALYFVPIVGVALYGEIWESVVVLGFDLAAFVTTVAAIGPHVAAAGPRRVFFFTCIAILVSLGIQTLRHRLGVSNERTQRLLRQAEASNEAARRLATLSEPSAITAIGVELAVSMVFSPDAEVRRACYYRIVDGFVKVHEHPDGSAKADSLDQVVWSDRVLDEEWLLREHPGLRQAVTTCQPVAARLEPDEVGPGLRPLLEQLGITHGAWVPVCPEGTLHGVLAVADRGKPVPKESYDRLIGVGHLMELALATWAAHEKLQEQATLDERRRITASSTTGWPTSSLSSPARHGACVTMHHALRWTCGPWLAQPTVHSTRPVAPSPCSP